MLCLIVSDVLVAPPTCYLSYVHDKLKPGFNICAQNCHKVAKGAFTGEIRYLRL